MHTFIKQEGVSHQGTESAMNWETGLMKPSAPEIKQNKVKNISLRRDVRG